ncbi:PglL family O-oligosaccharyltransferase [Halopseudomonas bauzanensis]|uniref:PglL family O-oligosaccharyltransferase n=1 Tax=Halopseudomonas bauzanensis TaxID=653930 RepID=UPI002556142F|nr:O-antigen ligase family protein [Halopseudomonas bauzanensis]
MSWLWPFRAPPQAGFTQEAIAFTAAILILLPLLFSKIRVQASSVLCLGLAAIPMLQNWFGLIPFSGSAWLLSIYLAAFSLMLLAGNQMVGRQESIVPFAAILAAAFLFAAVLSTWIALRQYFLLADSTWEINHNHGRPYANLAQPNNLATLLGMGLAGCLYFYEKRLLGRLSAGILGLFLMIGIAVTQSRTPWVTTIVIITLWAVKSKNSKLRLPLFWLILWVLSYIAIVISLPHLNDYLQLGGVSLADRAMASGRLSLWSQLWYAVWNGPFWGYGWNQTIAGQLSVMAERPLSMMATYSHNILLDLLLWNGLIPGALIVFAIAIWLARIGYFVNSEEGLFSLVAASFILTHSMFEYPFAYAYFLLPLGLLLGIANADGPTRYLFQIPRIALITVILCGLWILKIALADYNIIKADYQAQKMAAANVIGFESNTPISKVVFLTQLKELQRFRAMEPRSGYDDEELKWMAAVVQQYPHLANLYRYTLILLMNGKADQAERYLDLLCKLHGDNFCDQARSELENAMGANWGQMNNKI